jgi:hypothetical protein
MTMATPEPPTIITTIERVFHEPRMTVTHDPITDVYIVTMNEIHCVELEMEHPTRRIVIKSIFKCASPGDTVGSGKHLVNTLAHLAQEMGYDLVIETDVSRIVLPSEILPKSAISLRYLYMLSTGHSWYNSMGFYEAKYLEHKVCADRYIQTTPIKIVIRPDIRARVLAHRADLNLSLLTQGTVQEVFTAMSADITKILRQWETILRAGGDVDQAILPEERKLVALYRDRIVDHGKRLMEACGMLSSTKFSDLVYRTSPPTGDTESPEPPTKRPRTQGGAATTTRAHTHKKKGRNSTRRVRFLL